MQQAETRVVGAEVVQGETVIVTFSDGTVKIFHVDDLLRSAPVGHRTETSDAGKTQTTSNEDPNQLAGCGH